MTSPDINFNTIALAFIAMLNAWGLAWIANLKRMARGEVVHREQNSKGIERIESCRTKNDAV